MPPHDHRAPLRRRSSNSSLRYHRRRAFFPRATGDAGSESPPSPETVHTATELKKEKSADRMHFVTSAAALVEMIPDTPTRPSKRKPSRIFEPLEETDAAERGKEREPKPSLLSAMRRPNSLQPNRNQRHASDESASIGRSASNTLVSPVWRTWEKTHRKEGGGSSVG